MPHYDLHCHSTRSDGLLTPADVVRRAASRGVDVLALTDHDEVAGLEEAREAARAAGISFIDGSELSVTWGGETVHVVALGIDPDNVELNEGLAAVRSGRDSRARRIGDALEQSGIPDAFDGASTFVTSPRLISRTHFARYLIETGYVRDMKEAFKRYLTSGQARLCASRLGDARAGGGLDPRRRGAGGDRASGPVQAHRLRSCVR